MAGQPYSKDTQLTRSPGSGKRCPTTGKFRVSCTCRVCVGKRNRRKGQVAQRSQRKALERISGRPVVGSVAQGGNEENWRGEFRVEAKSGKQVESLTVRFIAAETQSNMAKAIGDSRPFVFAAAPDSFGGDAIWAMRRSELERYLVGRD